VHVVDEPAPPRAMNITAPDYPPGTNEFEAAGSNLRPLQPIRGPACAGCAALTWNVKLLRG